MVLSPCNTATDMTGRELIEHGSAAFPMACYHDRLNQMPVPWHWHEELEAAIVTRGSIVLAVEGEQITLTQGEGFFINTGRVHGVWELPGTGAELHSLVFHPRLVGGDGDSVFFRKYLLPMMNDPQLEHLGLRRDQDWQGQALEAIDKAWNSCTQEPEGYEFLTRQALSVLIFLLSRHLASSDAPAAKQLRDSQRIKIMLRFIHDGFAGELDTRAIAQSAAISESECLRCFRATLGMTPIRYLREYRIRKAAGMLLAGGERVADIGFRCGFQDTSYFTKTFRELQGMTPREYRTKNGRKV